ncbi:hypothetical protein Plhal703r1_c38g0136031 [Plasmopara halstedii]
MIKKNTSPSVLFRPRMPLGKLVLKQVVGFVGSELICSSTAANRVTISHLAKQAIDTLRPIRLVLDVVQTHILANKEELVYALKANMDETVAYKYLTDCKYDILESHLELR